MLSRFGVKQLGSILNGTAIWPGNIPVWTASVATAVAPVAAMPTTASHATLWNGNAPGSGVCLIVLAAGTIITTSAGAAINLSLAACLNTALVTSITGTTANTIRGLQVAGGGTQSYGGAAQFKSAVTIVNDGDWQPITPTIVIANTANIMSTIENYDLVGDFIVQPGQQFNLATLCNAAGSAVCKPWVRWAEVTFATS